MDWEAWARRAESALDFGRPGSWRALFADNATFGDPHTPSTRDLGRISKQTGRLFPDWRQEITRIRGDEHWAVFEWIGYGTFSGRNGELEGVPIEMHGATIVEVDADGLVTSWRDYLDRKEPEEQILSALRERESAQDGESVDPADGTMRRRE